MFPQTHIYFAQKVLGKLPEAAALGSIFPDMIISREINHQKAHSAGRVLINNNTVQREILQDFTRGVITHGIDPAGLDYYGDEKYPGCERGYCFEKGRAFIESTTRACNIPERMGWWKAHNIVEMGIELYIGSSNMYGEIIRQTCSNEELIRELGEILPRELCPDLHFLKSRIKRFPYYIEVREVTPQRLAEKYKIQMYSKHGIQIDTREVARLIDSTATVVVDDIEDFFHLVQQKIDPYLKGIPAGQPGPRALS